MPWSAATADTAKCKRQFIGFARRRISTTVSPWTCSAIPKRRTELKLLKPSTTSERGKKVPLMMLKTHFSDEIKAGKIIRICRGKIQYYKYSDLQRIKGQWKRLDDKIYNRLGVRIAPPHYNSVLS